MKIQKVSFVIPCFDESEVLPELVRRVRAVADGWTDRESEFVFVDDGSRDSTGLLLDDAAAADPRVKVLHLAANRGHQIAITAGIDFATGDLIVTMDADLQDPPEMAGEMVAKAEEGFDIVHAQRRTRAGESRFKRATAGLFYRLLERTSSTPILRDCGDFRAITMPVARVIREFREPHRFLRGTFAQLGFRQCAVPYDRDARFRGTTKYSWARMARLAVDGILGLSTVPLRLLFWGAALLGAASVLALAGALYEGLVLGIGEPRWGALGFVATFVPACVLLSLGVLGSYVGRIFEMDRRRPLYWMRAAKNLDVQALEEASSEVPEVRLTLQGLAGWGR